MTFKLITLGSNSALPAIDKYPSAHVLNIHEQFYLIDAGEGVQMQLKRYGISLLKINHIFISHLHGDHVYGLFGLIATMGLLGRKIPLNIYAPNPMREIMYNHFKYFESHLPYRVDIHIISDCEGNPVYSNQFLEVYAIPLEHTLPSLVLFFRKRLLKEI